MEKISQLKSNHPIITLFLPGQRRGPPRGRGRGGRRRGEVLEAVNGAVPGGRHEARKYVAAEGKFTLHIARHYKFHAYHLCLFIFAVYFFICVL